MYPYNSGFSTCGVGYYNPPSTSNGPPRIQSANAVPISSANRANSIEGDSFVRTSAPSDSAAPDLIFTNFNQLTPENIQQAGPIGGIIFDVDDTLSKFQLGSDRSIPQELKDRLLVLQSSGIQLGIVSNNPDSKLIQQLQSELADAGIQVPVISNGQKPSTKGLEMMQQYMGLPPNQIMMIGDNPETDIESGKKAGFKTAQVDWFNTSELHKKGMEWGDKALNMVDNVTNFFNPDGSEPQFFPPPSSAPIPVEA